MADLNAIQNQVNQIKAKTATLVPQVAQVSGTPQTTSTTQPGTPTAISADSLRPVAPIVLPNQKPDTTNYSAMINGGNAAIDSLTKANAANVTPASTPDTSTADLFTDLFKQYLGGETAPTNRADEYNSMENSTGIDDKTKQINDVNAQIADINAKVQASNLALERSAAKSGDVTTSFLGREQAEQNRQAAIQVLPLQAQALALQGSLKAAQDKLDTTFKLQSDYEDKLYNYNKDLRDKVYQFSTDEQKRKQAAQQKKDDQDFQLFRDNLKNAQSLEKTAMDNGAPAIAAKITALDPKSTTYKADLADLEASIPPDPTKMQDRILKSLQIQNQQLDNQKLIREAKENGGDTINLTKDDGSSISVPVDVAPYFNTASNGVDYIDASSIQGTAAEKKAVIDEAQKSGFKIITNKNTAADLVNIKDANAKLDTVSTIMAGIAQPGWLSRTLYGLGMTKLATTTQSDPQKAAAGALESVGLDVLKAISGVQGFRGNSSVVQQITDHLPKVTDTVDTVNQKVSYIKQLISDREDAAVGKAQTVDTNHPDQTVGGVTYSYSASDGLYHSK
jgi:hypothetical protein